MKYLFILFISFINADCSPKLSPDHNWGNQRWVLVELKGVPVQQSGGRRDAYLDFEVGLRKFAGNGGCNQINGNYSLDKNAISFHELISTKMSCNDIEFENLFISTLENIDRFETRGNDLLLKRRQEVLLVLRTK